MTQALARHWIRLGVRGSVVIVGSQAGRVALVDRAAYGSSKAAIEQLTRNLAFEWAQYGIRVNAVAPTFVFTELTRDARGRGSGRSALLADIPLGRFGQPADIAGPVAFLLGQESALITGHTP